MSRKSDSKKSSKSSKHLSDDDARDDASEVESEMNSIEYDVDYKVSALQAPTKRELLEFLNDPNLIRPSGDPNSNIIDAFSNRAFQVPDVKIGKLFKLLERCYTANNKIMVAEKQLEYSGIMIDFDIMQDCENSQLTDEMIICLCQKICEILTRIISFKNEKEVHYFGITRRPKVTYKDEAACYKDGFHILIPSLKIKRAVKRLLLSKIIENEFAEKYLKDVKPANLKIKSRQYTNQDFVDLNSKHVPVFFLGSNTKKGNLAYRLTNIFKATIDVKNTGVILMPCDDQFAKPKINIVNEFSLNWESPGGIIKKIHYEPQDRYVKEIEEYETKNKRIEDEAVRNHGMLSLNAIHDIYYKEIKDLIDTLDVKRADDYQSWFSIMCILANTSSSYKDLAEYFSRKSPKFSQSEFEKYWTGIINGSNKNKKMLMIGSLHMMAKQDNPERYAQLRKEMVYTVLYNMVYESYKEGILEHYDIAKLLHQLLKHKFVTDTPIGERKKVWYEFMIDDDQYLPGELYKWHRHSDEPTSLTMYISETLPSLFETVFRHVKTNYDRSSGDSSAYYIKVLNNIKKTMRNLGNTNFKANVMKEACGKFHRRGFSESLDKNPFIRGVANGILKLNPGHKPQLIQGYHGYLVSKHTDVPYIPFNPNDPITKDILYKLRNLFPANEPDSFEFVMYYLSSTIDGSPKDSMFMLMVGKGSNGKSTLVELHRGAIGNNYSVKLNLNFLTSKNVNAEAATPSVMMLKDASLATYSESDKNEKLNAARMKEFTGQETIAGRKLHSDMINFKPRCHHLVTSNYEFDIENGDYGTWRRIVYIILKIKFVSILKERIDPNNPYERPAESIAKSWPEDPEIRGRYLGIMVWYHYWLYLKYNGCVDNIPRPHIQFETDKYQRRQNVMDNFLAQRFVKMAEPDTMTPLNDEIQKYIRWYSINQGGLLPAKGIIDQFQNSKVGRHITMNSRGLYLVGHRFLDNNEQLAEGEEYAMKNVFTLESPPDNFGIPTETTEDFYTRICSEYERVKDVFAESSNYEADVDEILGQRNANYKALHSIVVQQPVAPPSYDDLEEDGELTGTGTKVLSNGVVIRLLDHPKTASAQDYYEEMIGILNYPEEMSDGE